MAYNQGGQPTILHPIAGPNDGRSRSPLTTGTFVDVK